MADDKSTLSKLATTEKDSANKAKKDSKKLKELRTSIMEDKASVAKTKMTALPEEEIRVLKREISKSAPKVTIPPKALKSVKMVRKGGNWMQLAWLSARDEDYPLQYQFEWKPRIGGVWQEVPLRRPLDRKIKVRRLWPGMEYLFRVRTRNLVGWSEWTRSDPMRVPDAKWSCRSHSGMSAMMQVRGGFCNAQMEIHTLSDAAELRMSGLVGWDFGIEGDGTMKVRHILTLSLCVSYTPTHCLSLVLVVMIQPKELKTKKLKTQISHTHSLILSMCIFLILSLLHP